MSPPMRGRHWRRTARTPWLGAGPVHRRVTVGAWAPGRCSDSNGAGGGMSPRSLPACAAIQSDRHLIATGRYGALSPTSHIRPSAVTRRFHRAVIRATGPLWNLPDVLREQLDPAGTLSSGERQRNAQTSENWAREIERYAARTNRTDTQISHPPRRYAAPFRPAPNAALCGSQCRRLTRRPTGRSLRTAGCRPGSASRPTRDCPRARSR